MVAEKLDRIMSDKHITRTKLAEMLGTSLQNLCNKFYRDNFTVKDLIAILDCLDCQLMIESRPDTRIIFSLDDD